MRHNQLFFVSLHANMKITLLLLGRTADAHIAALMADYEKRLRHYLTFDVQVLPELKNTKSLSEQQQKQAEGEAIIKAVPSNAYVVLFDEHGTELRSVELADWLNKKMRSLSAPIVFVIGGPYGFSDAVYERCNGKLSLSKLTFSHQMVRLIALEQLYRAMTILHGEPYHHE